MTEAQAAVGPDRLPWLSDEPRRRAKQGSRELLGWAFAVILLVAGVSYWLGLHSVAPASRPPTDNPQPRPGATVALPAPRPAPAEPPLPAPPLPEVVPPAPSVPAVQEAAPKPSAAPTRKAKVQRRAKARVKARAAKPATPARRKAKVSGPPVWPVRVVEGTTGRMVRIGTFSTRRQAKKGWWAVMRAYPGMQRLPALVVPVQSARNGRTYYRLQFGTTSQAHSEVLCQRMRIIGQSCIVIGLDRARNGK